LIRIDTAGWTTIRPDAAELLKQLHDDGVRIGILSNATIEMAAAARQSVWAQWVADWFFSAELGIVKPYPAIYQHVTETIGLPSDSIIYIDDNQRSVDGALATGWNAHLWTSGADTARLLNGLMWAN
jgi:putative hydrolase of the HAD superfamily